MNGKQQSRTAIEPVGGDYALHVLEFELRSGINVMEIGMFLSEEDRLLSAQIDGRSLMVGIYSIMFFDKADVQSRLAVYEKVLQHEVFR